MDNAPRGGSNGLVLWLLRSPLHRMLSGHVCQLDYVGRVSGAARRLPVEFVRDDDRLLVLAGHAEGKGWWRNFTGGGRPLTVTVARRAHEASGVAIGPGDPGYPEALRRYGQHRRPPRGTDHRLVAIRLLG